MERSETLELDPGYFLTYDLGSDGLAWAILRREDDGSYTVLDAHFHAAS